MEHNIKVIAHLYNDFTDKFGIPRQSGILDEMLSEIIFEPEYRKEVAFRGIEGFTHLWLIWQFSESVRGTWSPTVRPPRLGGNKRMGVFATRSPFRPNPIGLSCVKLEKLSLTAEKGPVLLVSGADVMNRTPIYDIKPYLPYADRIEGASGGFTDEVEKELLEVRFPAELLNNIPPDKQKTLLKLLSNDPRPSYQNDPDRVYGFFFSDFEIKFKVCGQTLTVVSAENKIKKTWNFD